MNGLVEFAQVKKHKLSGIVIGLHVGVYSYLFLYDKIESYLETYVMIMVQAVRSSYFPCNSDVCNVFPYMLISF